MLEFVFRAGVGLSLAATSTVDDQGRQPAPRHGLMLISVSAGALMWGGAALAAEPADRGASTIGELVVTAEHQIQFATPSAMLENSGLRFPGAPRQYGIRLEKMF